MRRPIAVKKGIFADHTIIYILPQINERVNPRRHLAVHNATELQGFFPFSSSLYFQRNVSDKK